MNKVELLGRLTKDVEVRYTQTTNKAVASFTIAVNRRFSKEGEQQADFINVVAWGTTGEFANKYFSKGQQIALVGRIQTRNYEDDKGQKHYVTEVIAEELYFAGNKKEDATNETTYNKQETQGTQTEIPEVMNEDDLPF